MKEYEINITIIVEAENEEQAQTKTEFILSEEPIFNNTGIHADINELYQIE